MQAMIAVPFLAALVVSVSLTAPATASPPCGAEARARLLAPPGPDDDTVSLTCSIRLRPGDRIARKILLEGSAASGVTLDCAGATLGRTDPPPAFSDFAVEIRSRQPTPGSPHWERPVDVTLRDCTILGNVRIWGMGLNGQGDAVRQSSRRPGHTERAQGAAPSRIRILDSRLTALGAIPLYLAPGVTGVTLSGSTLDGTSSAVALYLDAESGGNTITNNTFAVSAGREMVAVDGSARNTITGNRFVLGSRGGIHLYRNCGEGGTVRHQTPSDNLITGNSFRQTGLWRSEPVKVGSRGGWGWTMNCDADAGYPFGSSLDDDDHATGNVVEGNRVE
ncbi:hypothetical protein ASG40_06855 [Methylobacterium sp. Leaf399]|nr:hypothetical protein ASG40_06855 [Methylobacterium sp. Leaf399]KQT84272.1 hypothetical protein ASG59_02450 [Methylobacterium sp. Leaf466]